MSPIPKQMFLVCYKHILTLDGILNYICVVPNAYLVYWLWVKKGFCAFNSICKAVPVRVAGADIWKFFEFKRGSFRPQGYKFTILPRLHNKHITDVNFTLWKNRWLEIQVSNFKFALSEKLPATAYKL